MTALAQETTPMQRLLFRPSDASRLVAQANHDASLAAEQALATAVDFLPRVARGMQHSAGLLRTGKVSEGIALFTESCDGLNWFFGLMSSLEWLLPPQNGHKTWEQQATHFQQTLQAIESAMISEDWVEVCDQLSYDWVPVILAWSDALPGSLAELKSLNENNPA